MLTYLEPVIVKWGGVIKVLVFGKNNDNGVCEILEIKEVVSFINFSNFDTIRSYQKLIRDIKEISKHKSEIDELNSFTELFSPKKYTARLLELKANYWQALVL